MNSTVALDMFPTVRSTSREGCICSSERPIADCTRSRMLRPPGCTAQRCTSAAPTPPRPSIGSSAVVMLAPMIDGT